MTTSSGDPVLGVYRYRLPVDPPIRHLDRSMDERRGLIVTLDGGGIDACAGEAAPFPGLDAVPLDEVERILVSWCRDVSRGRVSTEGLPPIVDWAVSPILDALGRLPVQPTQSTRVTSPDGAPGIATDIDQIAAPTGAVAADDDTDDGGNRLLAVNALVGPDPVAAQLPRLIDMAARVERRRPTGHRHTVKVKVPGEPDEAAARVEAVAQVLSEWTLRVDANRRMTVDNGMRFRDRLSDDSVGRIEYLEDPSPDLDTLVELHERTALPVALDEHAAAIFATTRDPGTTAATLRQIPGLAAVVVKPPQYGGAGTIRTFARALAVPVVISDTYQSGVGVAALVELATSLLPTACGLDTYRYLRHDLFEPALPITLLTSDRDVREAAHGIRHDRLELVESIPIHRESFG